MKVMYNVTGADRKKLVGAISEIVGERMEYLGMPSSGYRVGYYNIDKEGTLTIPSGTDAETVERLITQLEMKGFTDTGRKDEAAQEDANTLESAPEDEPLLIEAPESDESPEEAAAPETPPEEHAAFTIEVPLEGFTDAQFLNIEKLIASKASLIKKSLRVDALPIVKDGERLTFPWFHRELIGFEIQTYTHFIAALCAVSKTQKRVTATDKDVPSERFTFRIFLLKLGFAGAQYADERKLLYANLSGDCAFPTTAKRDEHAARWNEIRKQRRAEQLLNQDEADTSANEEDNQEQEPESEDEQPDKVTYDERVGLETELLNQEEMEEAV